jgi:ketosteroid isomerase-like protein
VSTSVTLVHELVGLSNELVRAVQERDPGRLETMLAREFTLLGAAGELDREELIAAASGRYAIEDFGYEEIDPEVYGDTAVLVSRYRQTARLDGRDVSAHLHVTDIWVRREGRWQIVRRHGTLAA